MLSHACRLIDVMFDMPDGWWSFTHDWAQNKNKLVKFWYCPKTHIFLYCVQWSVSICMIFMDFVNEWGKKFLDQFPWWKLCISTIGSKLYFSHDGSDFWLDKASDQWSMKCFTPLIFIQNHETIFINIVTKLQL